MPVQVDEEKYVLIPEDGHIEVQRGASLHGLKEDVVRLGVKTDFLSYVVAAVLLALFIGFVSVLATLAGILTDIWRYNVNSYIDYQNSEKQTMQRFNDWEARWQQVVEQVSAIKGNGGSLDEMEAIKK